MASHQRDCVQTKIGANGCNTVMRYFCYFLSLSLTIDFQHRQRRNGDLTKRFHQVQILYRIQCDVQRGLLAEGRRKKDSDDGREGGIERERETSPGKGPTWLAPRFVFRLSIHLVDVILISRFATMIVLRCFFGHSVF